VGGDGGGGKQTAALSLGNGSQSPTLPTLDCPTNHLLYCKLLF